MSASDVHKRTLYVGGLDEHVNEAILHAAFLAFGDIVDVQIPIDLQNNKHRGFGFVTFELEEDARAAMENMHHSEIFGRVLKVNIAKPQAVTNRHKAVWEEAGYFEKIKERDIEKQKEKEAAAAAAAAASASSSSAPSTTPPSSDTASASHDS
ncbi:peptidyl-prolyl cis-trans isomerase E [Pelomyxa schiedti]|nr:peptidyl-prolyl cis-trans isomerase E [Pelomyxa schiedti]